MALLRSGLIIAAGYAQKVRRVLFAQTRDLVKNGQLSLRDVAGAARQLNMILYELIVEELRLEKGDVVRISIEYEIEDSTIRWKMDTLVVEVWKRMADEYVSEKVEKIRSRGVAGEE
ncbi:MAG: DUF2258 domain-containing protein [Acidilobaceae archaeon]